ncbi:hypothetical protein BAUCODRAFT_136968 [Baudoinia panamericana UAMH 10762]|uniref:Uncharacterized protein n=1 Tax=Baudoinia panamericana (strain UAMH 10762) TaxID=717646 RepID=M2NH99_BAUPA|nr:uncharacterized protein BAUCODRAFT_136968 [Baudoinia panamericana UAMH 10762]EMC98714.1 hypothetical protein BAUCODRAFT_136968 [Baudoinia panamericana UAMH 10762]
MTICSGAYFLVQNSNLSDSIIPVICLANGAPAVPFFVGWDNFEWHDTSWLILDPSLLLSITLSFGRVYFRTGQKYRSRVGPYRS